MSIDPNTVVAAILAGVIRYILDRTFPKIEGMLKRKFRSGKKDDHS